MLKDWRLGRWSPPSHLKISSLELCRPRSEPLPTSPVSAGTNDKSAAAAAACTSNMGKEAGMAVLRRAVGGRDQVGEGGHGGGDQLGGDGPVMGGTGVCMGNFPTAIPPHAYLPLPCTPLSSCRCWPMCMSTGCSSGGVTADPSSAAFRSQPPWTTRTRYSPSGGVTGRFLGVTGWFGPWSSAFGVTQGYRV